MAQPPAFIGIDWGTTNARFLLIDDAGEIIEQRGGPGIGQIASREGIEQVCFDTIGAWLNQTRDLPVIMAGMVGSNMGWHGAGYIETPARVVDLIAGLTRFRARGQEFMIVPGLSTRRRDGLPDLMRGEEIQIFGAAPDDRAVFCLPGTHSKWATYSGGMITGFHTALTGELLRLIGCHSILLNPKRPVLAAVDDAFRHGVQTAQNSEIGMESLLFSVRSRQIAGKLTDGDAENYLAGLIIGCEIRSAAALYGHQQPITLVGAPELTALYACALTCFGMASAQFNGDRASLLGLGKIHRGL